MEIARIYIDKEGKIKVMLAGKYTESLLEKLVEQIETVHTDMKSAKEGEGKEGLSFSVELGGKINVATRKRIAQLKATGESAIIIPPDVVSPLPRKKNRFFKDEKGENE